MCVTLTDFLNCIILVRNGINISKNHSQYDLSSDDDVDGDEEKFYTPPSSPSLIEETDTESEDEFNDSELPKCDIFIERYLIIPF